VADLSASARPTFDRASAVIGVDLWAAGLDASAQAIARPSLLQPLLVAWAVADYERGRAQLPGLPVPDFVLGHSSGQNSAMVLSGAVSFEAGVGFAHARGLLQDAACHAGAHGLLAVSGLGRAAVESVAVAHRLVVANRNAEDQFVLAGPDANADAAMAAIDAQGGRGVRLRLAGAFHSDAFREVDAQSQPLIDALPIAPGFTPLIGNRAGQLIRDPAALREELSMQFTRPVCWTDALAASYREGVRTYVVTGPGNAMAGLIRRFGRVAAEPLRTIRLNAPLDSALPSASASASVSAPALPLESPLE
jgi:[acyl-carrier-protein] S-malonyltransferase